MSDAEELAVIVREWAAKADNDPKTADATLALGPECPSDTTCFHAQQCVEKYWKALLTSRNIEFPKTHVLGTLLALLPASPLAELTPERHRQLTEYATAGRYPGTTQAIPLAEAVDAVALARRARDAIRMQLAGILQA